MVRRDPETGQFVSEGVANWSDTKQFAAVNHYDIPAADLSGGTSTSNNVSGGNAEILDFTSHLENDEVYHVDAAFVQAGIDMPTTATAESHGQFAFQVGSSNDKGPTWQVSAPFYGAGVDREQGIVDIASTGWEASGSWFQGRLNVTGDVGDSTNGLGAGADHDNMAELIPFSTMLGTGPVYDRDDELYAPAELQVDNVSDHAVSAFVQVMLYGRVETLD